MTAARGERTLALLVGGGLAAIFLLWAAFSVAGWTLGTAGGSDHQVIRGPVKALRIDGVGRQDVFVEAAGGPDVTIDSTARGSFRAPRLSVEVDGATVRISGGCGAVWFSHCRASVTVTVPPGTPVTVSSDSGDVSATGLSGPVDLRTSSGDIDVHDMSGTAALETASGDVAADGLGSGIVHARTGSGDVDLLFSAAPRSVDAETGSGDVALLLPRGAAYAVDAETSSGDRTLGLRTDPRSPRVLRARTGSGDVSVFYVD